MITAQQLVDAYHRWNITFVERPGWRTRNTGRSFDPIGIVVHHDALNDQVSTERGLQIIEQGRPDLAGPLAANWHEDDGTLYLCSFGNSNHGGRFAANPVARTRAGLPPLGDAGALGLVDDGPVANGIYYGDEVHNAGDGRDPYEPGQMQTLTLSLAARCELHGWTGARVIGHREGTRRKIDPRGIDMTALRQAVDVCLYVGPDVATPTPLPTEPPEDEDMDYRVIYQTANQTRFWMHNTLSGLTYELGSKAEADWFIGLGIPTVWVADETLANAIAAGTR
jgi:hypothetical protein